MKPQTLAGIIPELRRRQGEKSKASDLKTGPGGIGIEIARRAETDFTGLSWNCPWDSYCMVSVQSTGTKPVCVLSTWQVSLGMPDKAKSQASEPMVGGVASAPC